jgi:hypothetical protein
MEYEINFLKALLLTIVIETSVLFFLFNLFFRTRKVNFWIILLTGIVASFSTLPYLWFILPLVIKTKIWYMIISEISAVMIESVIILGLLRIKYTKALLVSIACNMSSFLLGLLIKF